MRDRETQIMAISIVFFVLAFPTYFYLAADKADSGAGLNSVNTYVIEGDLTYIELASGTEFIADDDTFPIDDVSTDSIDDADELNIIGVRLTLSYTEEAKRPMVQPVRQQFWATCSRLNYWNDNAR